MKKLKNYLLVLAMCLPVSIALTSCLGSDDDTDPLEGYHLLTASDKAQCMNAVAGDYSGYAYYYKSTGAVDSTIVSCRIGRDSTFVMDEFPVHILTNYVHSTDNQTILENIGTETMSATTSLPTYAIESNFTAGYYEFTLTPETMSFMDSEDHTVKITFNRYMATGSYGNYIYTMFAYYQNQIQGYILIDDVEIDGSTYDVNMPIQFYMKK